MQKLSEIIRIEPQRSSLEVTCMVNTQHVSRLYYTFTVKLPNAVFETDAHNGAIMPSPQLDMRVCPQCMIVFMGDAHEAIQKMNVLQ